MATLKTEQQIDQDINDLALPDHRADKSIMWWMQANSGISPSRRIQIHEDYINADLYLNPDIFPGEMTQQIDWS